MAAAALLVYLVCGDIHRPVDPVRIVAAPARNFPHMEIIAVPGDDVAVAVAAVRGACYPPAIGMAGGNGIVAGRAAESAMSCTAELFRIDEPLIVDPCRIAVTGHTDGVFALTVAIRITGPLGESCPGSGGKQRRQED